MCIIQSMCIIPVVCIGNGMTAIAPAIADMGWPGGGRG